MINNVVLMGRICHDLELKATPSGISVMRLSIAVDRGYKKQDEERKTDFIDVVLWRNTAEFVARYFKKGQMIAITGAIQTENYTDKNGNKRKSVEVVANAVSFCGDKAESSQKPANINIDFDDIEIIDDGTDDEPQKLPWL